MVPFIFIAASELVSTVVSKRLGLVKILLILNALLLLVQIPHHKLVLLMVQKGLLVATLSSMRKVSQVLAKSAIKIDASAKRVSA